MTSQQIERIKSIARDANKAGNMLLVDRCIKWLDQHWHDDRAAMAFYTELEQSAEFEYDPNEMFPFATSKQTMTN